MSIYTVLPINVAVRATIQFGDIIQSGCCLRFATVDQSQLCTFTWTVNVLYLMMNLAINVCKFSYLWGITGKLYHPHNTAHLVHYISNQQSAMMKTDAGTCASLSVSLLTTTSYYIYNIHISFPPQVITLVAVPSYLTIYLHMSSNLTFHVISISTTILTVSAFGDGLNGLRTQVGT